jgi:hypothetical protein
MQNPDVQRGLQRAGFDTVTAAGDAPAALPEAFSLEQNYPNPFNPVTRLRFHLSSRHSGAVQLTIYDLLGREVAVVLNDRLPPGSYTRSWDAGGAPGGIYFARLTTPGGSVTQKLTLLR